MSTPSRRIIWLRYWLVITSAAVSIGGTVLAIALTFTSPGAAAVTAVSSTTPAWAFGIRGAPRMRRAIALAESVYHDEEDQP